MLAREPVWAGTGLDALGLVAGELVDPVAAQRLVQGRHPLTGLVLREPRMQTHPHAKLDGAPFAAALRAVAPGRWRRPRPRWSTRSRRWPGYASRGRHGGGLLSRHVDGQGLAAVVLPHFLARRTEDGNPGDPHLHAHLTFPTLLQGADDAWGAFGSGGHELYRHIAALGELAKARLRQRLHARLGMTFVFEPDTGEWEVVGVPLVLRRFWSSRREAIRAEAGPGASAAARRPAAAKPAERQRRQQRWEDVVLLERWHAEATALVDDMPAMFASAVPGTPATATAPPTVEEVTARLQLPRAVAVRRKGAEFREVLAAVINASSSARGARQGVRSCRARGRSARPSRHRDRAGGGRAPAGHP